MRSVLALRLFLISSRCADARSLATLVRSLFSLFRDVPNLKLSLLTYLSSLLISLFGNSNLLRGWLTVTPVSEEVLSQYEARLVAALLNATEDQYENRWRALSMLHTLARSSASVRNRLRDPDAMMLIMECGTQFSVESSPRHEWLIAADLLTTIMKDPEAAATITEHNAVIKKFLNKYAESKNPVAMIVHARFGEDWNHPAPTTSFDRATENNMVQQALSECLAVDYSRSNVSGASLYSALGFALFGGVWGRLRWAMRLTRHGALTSHAWSWSAKKHIARPLALWFMADMLGTRLLTFASNDKFEFDQNTLKDISDIEARANVSGMSLTKTLQEFSHLLSSIPYSSNTSLASFLSVAQNCSFTLFSLWMISTRRYAFLPLAAAGVYNHYDQIKKIPQVDYIVGMGKMQANEAKNYFHKNSSL